MFCFQCPVCGGDLRRDASRWFCEKGHSFDIAKQGYVNLLMSNRSSAKRHGDDKTMILARQQFLEQGYYTCLRDSICEAALRYSGDAVNLLDAGCGEGWYTDAVLKAILESGRTCTACGVDISKAALIQAAKRNREFLLAIASIAALPVHSASVTLLLSVFAPVSDAEFRRVTKPGGILIYAAPSEEHLLDLKAAVYEKPYRNPKPDYAPEGFSLLQRIPLREQIHLRSKEDLMNLFMMTPYYYKTGKADQEKLEQYDSFDTRVGFDVFVFRRQ